MALFSFGKEKKDAGNGADQVLAYLEDAQRTRAPFTLAGPRKAEAAATVQGIDENAGLITFQLSTPLAADKGARVDFTFLQEGMRIGGAGTVAESRPGALVVALPDALELRERRGQPRARLNPKEGATLTALTGLFEGVGITGIVENLSEGGARVRVEKALNIKGEKRLPLGSALVPVGQPFILIKLNKVPKCPAVLELEGRAAYLDTATGGLVMGLVFDPPRPDVAAALRNLVASRTSAVPSALPPKARRRPEPAAGPVAPARPPAPAPEGEPPGPPAAARAPEPAPASPPPSPAAAAPAPSATPASAATPDPPARNEALLRLRKRSRGVVALTPDPAAAGILKDHLQAEGFGRVLATSDPDELRDFLQQPNLAALVIDGDLGPLVSLQMLGDLKAGLPSLPPVILAVEEASTGIVLAARRQGVAQVLVKPYALDGAFVELLNQFMEG